MKNVEGFSLQNWKLSLFNHPMEDGFSFNTGLKSIVVADGVTRDPCEELYDTSTIGGKIKFLRL